MKTNNTKPFPIVGTKEVIDLFHAVAYWRCTDREAKGILGPHRRWVTFDLAGKILNMAHILPERRIGTLRGNRDFFKLFLARTLVVPQTDTREWVTILAEERELPFAVKLTERELVSGCRIDPRDLFALRKIYLTARGMGAGPVVVRAVARLITYADYQKAWEQLTATSLPAVAFAARQKAYAAFLDGDKEGA